MHTVLLFIELLDSVTSIFIVSELGLVFLSIEVRFFVPTGRKLSLQNID